MPAKRPVRRTTSRPAALHTLLACLLAGFFAAALAADVPRLAAPAVASAASTRVRPFVSGSLARILAARQGRPFVLAFWSASCAYCPQELKVLAEARKAHPKLDVVLVAADTPEDAPLTADLAARYGLGQVEQWVFADAIEERLRFEIDSRWHGELPRTHFYDREHKLEVVTGIVPRPQLLAWVKAKLL